MSPESTHLIAVGAAASRCPLLRDALELAFPDVSSSVHTCADLTAALLEPPRIGITVLVLEAPSDQELESALAAEDGAAMPRWGVVVIGSGLIRPGLETVSFSELEPALLGRALRSALLQWRLRCDVVREQGDLWTLGRRLTHDLRNPLGCIVTTGEMLKESLASEAPSQVPFAEAVVESTAEIMTLLNRVHFMAKASAQPRPPETFDMEAARQAAVDRLQRELTRRGVEVVAPEDWPEVRGVRPWLEAVWGDLIANALRHGGEKPKIETTWRREGHGWRFFVVDNGPGVPADRVSQLFTPFHRLHQRHGGGLGLSIVHRLVWLHGGSCRYEARDEGGSIFSFTLPDHAKTASVKPADAVVMADSVMGVAGVAAMAPRAL